MIAMHTSPCKLANAAAHLHDDEIHVWYLAYRREQGRKPLRMLLGAYLGIEAKAVVLVDGEHGRPQLGSAHDPSLGFNWSHSGDHALIAMGRHVTPGIDLERLRNRPRALAIARRFFGNEESATLTALPAEARSAAFLELWTAKEAVLKAIGRGLAFGLDRLSITSGPAGLELVGLDGDDPRAWQLQRLSIDQLHVGALAWRGSVRKIQLRTLASQP
jgi:4'-phosphopantetheinyl transferase